jgi:hypothetical protein
VLSSTVSDRCVSVVWSIPALNRTHSANNGGNCWGTTLMQYDTGWNFNEANVPPTGSYAGTLTVTDRSGRTTSRSFTLNATAPATTQPPALTLSAVSQAPSPSTAGQYVLSSTVSDRCVSVVWSIPALNRTHSANNGGNCWGTTLMQYDTGWNFNEANVPPTGSYAGTLTVTDRSGRTTSRSFTLNVP